MPLFFIISGVFVASSLRKRGLRKYVDTRARAILYPYFVWGFLQLSMQMLFTRYTNGHPTPWSYFDLFYQPREIAQFWYLYALFNVSVIYAFSKQVLKLSAIQNIVIGLFLFYF
jgi:fucose 4-O-acetylase-like acetyltransferase